MQLDKLQFDTLHHALPFRRIYADIQEHGLTVKPRGLEIKEIENYSFDLPPFVRFTNFSARKFNLAYLKDEFRWYLVGDRFDTSITKKAKLWKSLVTDDGAINSNYGQYIFGMGQFDYIIDTLKDDPDSRRASIMILNPTHIASGDKDLPCTYSIGFRIREGALNMTVRMRSQDAIYGMSNDIPCFSFIHEMMLNALREFFPELEYGNYHHSVDSMHVYERHFEMLNQLTGNYEGRAYTYIPCPPISGPDEVRFLRRNDYQDIPETFKFTQWLNS